MDAYQDIFPFKRILSLDLLIEFWEDVARDETAALHAVARRVLDELESAPELRGEIADLSVLDRHSSLVSLIMSALFPAARRTDYVSAALVPYQMLSVFSTSGFEKLGILDNFHTRTTITGTPVDAEGMVMGKAVSAYQKILEYHYQILDTPEYPIIYTANAEEDGLPRYYSLSFDSRYAVPRPTGSLPKISQEQLAQVSEDPMNLETWKQI
ncbi:MAG: hypothetical protein KJO98_02780, partial [Rhodothermia bacterium]|nr:hypothetical protein [Rhodothermia bacterium]